MADIDVVPKKRSRLWLWIIAAIIIALIIWAIVAGTQPAPPRQGMTSLPARPMSSTLSSAATS